MTFSIDIDGVNNNISTRRVSTFIFTVDMTSLYSTCHLILQDFLQATFNRIRIGQGVTVRFIDGENTYENKMAILSFTKLPKAIDTAVDMLDIHLISAFYFSNQKPVTAHYSANTGAIISSIFSSKFPEIADANKSISPTTDTPAVRYQVNERYQDFMVRMLKHSSIEDLPTYLFTDYKGVTHLKGIAEAWKSDISAAPFLVTDRDADTQKLISNDKGAERIYARSYRVNGDGATAASSVEGLPTSINFLDSARTPAKTAFLTSERSNPQSSRVTPEVSKVFGWEISPQDAQSLLTREAFEANMDTFTINAVLNDFVGGDLNVMSNVEVILPYATNGFTRPNGSLASLGDGLYIVKSLQYVMEAPKDSKFTRVNLLQASY